MEELDDEAREGDPRAAPAALRSEASADPTDSQSSKSETPAGFPRRVGEVASTKGSVCEPSSAPMMLSTGWVVGSSTGDRSEFG